MIKRIMKFKVLFFCFGLLAASGAFSPISATPNMEMVEARASLTDRILKAAAVEFQSIGFDYSVEYLQREYYLGNVTIEELSGNEYRVTVGGGDTVLVVLEDFS